MKLSDFDYQLDPARIAQTPAEPRDSSRLLVHSRVNGDVQHRIFSQIGEFLNSGDVLVFNQTRVIPARLYGHKTETGGKIELLLLKQIDSHTWRGMVGGKGVRDGTRLTFTNDEVQISGEVIEEGDHAIRVIRFDEPLKPFLHQLGHVPLPPYITAPLSDPERYQTVYARDEGSAAAPTAGLHFTPDLLINLKQQGIQFAYCTLHVGLDTFQPVHEEDVSEHKMHSEEVILTADEARTINEAKLAGRRIIAVGTTSVRVLETAAMRAAGLDDPYAQAAMCPWKPVQAIKENTEIFIYPGFKFRAVDGLITNFHLPKSTLMMLVSAFAGRESILASYAIAQEEKYRFYSFGDAMLLI